MTVEHYDELIDAIGTDFRVLAIELPALVFWGQQDRSHAFTERTSTLKHIPGAEVIEFEQCGHFPELEDPKAFARHATPFLQSCLNT